jgi:serine/threonine protein kinase
MIFEYCPNGSLCDEISDDGGIPLDRFFSIAQQLLSALAFMHSQGVAHCDIKPSNVLIDIHGRPKFADFGIAQTRTRPLDEQTAGTWAFLAPEVLTHTATDRFKADVWALGVTFTFMLDGVLPWPTVPGRMREAVLKGSYLIMRKIPAPLADLIRWMFVVKPEARWSADQLLKHAYFAEQEGIARRKALAGVTALEPLGPSRLRSSFAGPLVRSRTDIVARQRERPIAKTQSHQLISYIRQRDGF